MKIIDAKISTVKVYIEHHEIIEMLNNKIRPHTGYDFTEYQFKFEFVKEGSPEYTTNKIRCIATKIIDEKHMTRDTN